MDEVNENDIVKKIHGHYKDSTAHLKDWFEEATESMKFFAGDQWSEEDKEALDSQDRPAIVFNRVAPFIDAVIGMEVNNRKEVRYIPREQGDIKVNEILTGAAEWARDNADAEDEESQAFTDMLATGLGWVETSVEYTEDPDGEIDMLRRDPFRMRYDTSATKRNLSDAQWILYVGDYTKDEIQQLWPDVDLSAAGTKGPWDSDIDELLNKEPDRDNDELDQYLTEGSDRQSFESCTSKIKVARYQYVKYEPIVRVATVDSGDIQEVGPDQWKQMEQDLLMAGTSYKSIRQKKRKIKQVYVMGSTVLEESDAPCDSLFSYSAITGKYDAIKGHYYGIVRPMKDPQKWANAFLSNILETLMANSKGGLIAEESAAADPRKLEETWADPTAVTWVAEGALQQGKVQPKPPANYPQGMDRLMQFAIQSFPDVTGINLEMLGLAGRDQAGIVETTRKQSGVTILAWAFDSLRRYRKHQGRVLAHLISNYIADGRLVRIVGQNDQNMPIEQFIPLLRDQINFKYDVIVDEAPTSPNMKERTFQILTELLPNLQAMGVPVPPTFLKYSPLPDSLTQEWLEHIAEIQRAQAEPDPGMEAMKQAMAAEKQAEAAKDFADADKKVAETEQTNLENKFLQSTGMMP